MKSRRLSRVSPLCRSRRSRTGRHDRVTEGIKRIESRFNRLTRRLNFDRIARSAQRFGQSLNGIGVGLARTTQRLGMMTAALGLGGGGLIAGLWRLTKGTAEYADQIAKTAARLGIGVEAL